jgi:hypothetical protein
MTNDDEQELRDTVTALHRAHVKLGRVVDTLAAGAAQLSLGAIPKYLVEDAVYDLYVAMDEHLADEERMLQRIVRRLPGDAAARVQLVLLEHESQREVLLAAVKHTEEGGLSAPDLVSLVGRLTRMVRADVELEEELFVDLTRAAPGSEARHSP